jgi:hypothetical protein
MRKVFDIILLQAFLFMLAEKAIGSEEKDRKIAHGAYKTMEEFANDWNPPLTAEELAIFEPEFSTNMTQFSFKKDATIRGVFCQAYVTLVMSKLSNTMTFLATSKHKPFPVCKYNNFTFSGGADFFKKPFSLKSITFTTPGQKYDYYYNFDGMKFQQITLFFHQAEIIKKQLESTPLRDKKYYITNEYEDFRSSVDVILAEPVKINGVVFPISSQLTFYYYEHRKKNGVLSAAHTIPGQEIVYDGISCLWLDIDTDGNLEACNIAKPLEFKTFAIPKLTRVTFDPKLKKNNKAHAVSFYDWPKDAIFNGTKRDPRKPWAIENDRLVEPHGLPFDK